jgi:hypothetical protein
MKWTKKISVTLIAPLLFTGCFTGPGMPNDPFVNTFPRAGTDLQKFMNDDNAVRIGPQFPRIRGFK